MLHNLATMQQYKSTYVLQSRSLDLKVSMYEISPLLRSAALARCLSQMRSVSSLSAALDSWRGECYDVRKGLHNEPLFQMERAATSQ